MCWPWGRRRRAQRDVPSSTEPPPLPSRTRTQGGHPPAQQAGPSPTSDVELTTASQPAGLLAARPTAPATVLSRTQEEAAQPISHPASNLGPAPSPHPDHHQQQQQGQHESTAVAPEVQPTAAPQAAAAPTNTPPWPWSGSNPQVHSHMAFMMGGMQQPLQLQPVPQPTPASAQTGGPVEATAVTPAGGAGVGAGAAATWAGLPPGRAHHHVLLPMFHPMSGSEHVGHSSGGLLHSSVPFSVPSLLEMLGTALEPILEGNPISPASTTTDTNSSQGPSAAGFQRSSAISSGDMRSRMRGFSRESLGAGPGSAGTSGGTHGALTARSRSFTSSRLKHQGSRPSPMSSRSISRISATQLHHTSGTIAGEGPSSGPPGSGTGRSSFGARAGHSFTHDSSAGSHGPASATGVRVTGGGGPEEQQRRTSAADRGEVGSTDLAELSATEEAASLMRDLIGHGAAYRSWLQQQQARPPTVPPAARSPERSPGREPSAVQARDTPPRSPPLPQAPSLLPPAAAASLSPPSAARSPKAAATTQEAPPTTSPSATLVTLAAQGTSPAEATRDLAAATAAGAAATPAPPSRAGSGGLPKPSVRFSTPVPETAQASRASDPVVPSKPSETVSGSTVRPAAATPSSRPTTDVKPGGDTVVGVGISQGRAQAMVQPASVLPTSLPGTASTQAGTSAADAGAHIGPQTVPELPAATAESPAPPSLGHSQPQRLITLPAVNVPVSSILDAPSAGPPAASPAFASTSGTGVSRSTTPPIPVSPTAGRRPSLPPPASSSGAAARELMARAVRQAGHAGTSPLPSLGARSLPHASRSPTVPAAGAEAALQQSTQDPPHSQQQAQPLNPQLMPDAAWLMVGGSGPPITRRRGASNPGGSQSMLLDRRRVAPRPRVEAPIFQMLDVSGEEEVPRAGLPESRIQHRLSSSSTGSPGASAFSQAPLFSHRSWSRSRQAPSLMQSTQPRLSLPYRPSSLGNRSGPPTPPDPAQPGIIGITRPVSSPLLLLRPDPVPLMPQGGPFLAPPPGLHRDNSLQLAGSSSLEQASDAVATAAMDDLIATFGSFGTGSGTGSSMGAVGQEAMAVAATTGLPLPEIQHL